MLLAGNALAVHDAEQALFGTSLGVDVEAGTPVIGGHRHHMRAINAINAAGGIRRAVATGVLTERRDGRVRPRAASTSSWPAASATTGRSSTP